MFIIHKKLQSNTGASLLFGLMAFLIATLVATVLVSAAMTSMKRVADNQAAQEAKLTLNSAAELLKKEVGNEDASCEIIEVKKIRKSDNSVQGNPTKTVKGSGLLKNELKTAVEHILSENSDYVSNAATGFTLKTEGAELQAVQVTFVMKAAAANRYQLIFTLSLESGETVYLTMDALTYEVSQSVDSGVGTATYQTTTTTTRILWNQGTISEKGGN